MKRIGFILFFAAVGGAAMLAQPAILPPSIGAVRDAAGSIRPLVGTAGSFLTGDAPITGAVSAAFSGAAGLVKTDAELLVLDAQLNITARYDAPSGPALFAFDQSGAPALIYYFSTAALFDLRGGDIKAAQLPSNGPVVAIGISGSDIRTLTSDDVTGPAFLTHAGSTIFVDGQELVVRDRAGIDRRIAIDFAVDSFEQVGKGWIGVRETGGLRHFALRLDKHDLELYQLPEVQQ